MAEQETNQSLDFPEELKARARDFFDRAADVAYTLNYDYAIELYLDGLSYWPDSLEEGHYKLRDIAMRRQAAGGKKAGFADSSRFKKLSAKAPKDAMLKAEYLLSKDPAHVGHMQDMIKAAAAGSYLLAGNWMADLLFDLTLQKEKPSINTFILLRDIYIELDNFPRAVQACQNALQMKPKDAALEASLRDLSAQSTMQRGKYDSDGDFRESIKDRQEQEKMQSQDQVVRSDSVKADLIADAREEYQADPTVPGKINNLVAALCSIEEFEYENEAVEILEKAFKESGQFSFQQHVGEIRIKQWHRKIRGYQEKLKSVPDDQVLKQKLAAAQETASIAELKHYQLCTENYPTDMRLKYEYGKRLLRNKQYDDAIPVLQEARSDPRHRIPALAGIGQCFFFKEWYPDAVETFEQALESVENKESATAKELLYNLGRAHEADGKLDDALTVFRRVAQLEFNFSDVRQRVDALRKKLRDTKQ